MRENIKYNFSYVRWLQNQLKEQAATSNKRSKENAIPLWMSNKLKREDNFRECLLVYLGRFYMMKETLCN